MPLAKMANKFAIFFSTILLSFTLNAAEGVQDYNKVDFDKAQANNQMIVVDIYKDGCGTCAKQEPALADARVKYPNAVFFRVDFANDDDAVKRFRAIKQSTIIVYRGNDERGRSLGETNHGKILSLIAQGV